MSKTKTAKTKTVKTEDAKAREALAAISPQFAAALDGDLGVATQGNAEAERKRKQPVLAPAGVDPHTMPVTDIVFDPALLDDFPDLKGGLKAASDHVFAQYRSPGKDKERHSLLHSRIGSFISQVRRSRQSGVPHVKQEVRRTAKQRDLLALLAEHGITSVDDLQSALGGDA